MENGMIAVAVLTAARKRAYIAETLDSYFSVPEFPTPFVLMEPDAPNFVGMSKCNIERNAEHLGCLKNWNRAVNVLCSWTNASYFLILEDDITFISPNSVMQKINDVLNQPKANEIVYSLYCSLVNRNPEFGAQHGWVTAKLNNRESWCGNLALLIPRNIAYDLVHSSEHDDNVSYRVHDSNIGHYCKRKNIPLLAHHPSLVRHIGEESTLVSKEKRKYWEPCRQGYYEPDYSTSK